MSAAERTAAWRLIRSGRERLRLAWRRRTAGERRWLLGGSASIAALLLIFGIWLPARAGLRSAEHEYGVQRELHAWVQAAASRIHGLSSAPSPQAADIERSLEEYKLTVHRFAIDKENRIAVQLEEVPFDRLVPWLNHLERELHVRIDHLEIDAPDRRPVLLNVSLELSR